MDLINYAIKTIFQGYTGKIQLMDGIDNAINKNNEIFYKLKYPSETLIPRIIAIRMNNEIICSGPDSSKYGVTTISLQHKLKPATNLNISPGNNPVSFPIETNFPPREIPIYQIPRTTTTRTPVTQPPPRSRTPEIQVYQFPRTTSTRTPVTQPPIPPSRTPEIIRRQPVPTAICGKIGPISSPLIFGGHPISKGAWPWLVAIYKIDSKSNPYFVCGGNIISSRTIITSAHCLGTNDASVSPGELLIGAGKHNISDFWESSQNLLYVERIIIHSDYRTSTYDADIAMIIVKEEIR